MNLRSERLIALMVTSLRPRAHIRQGRQDDPDTRRLTAVLPHGDGQGIWLRDEEAAARPNPL